MGKKNYDQLGKNIVTFVGGVGNIQSLSHCVTRLRFRLKDDSKADEKELRKLKGVLSVVQGNGQYQVVVGPAVADIFASIQKNHSIGNGAEEKEEKKSGNIFTRALNMIAVIINPIVIALAGAGMIKALLVILTTTLGVMDTTGSTYKILSAAGNSVFYFLPLFLAYSSAKAFNCNTYVALAIVASLMEPNFTKLMTKAGDMSSFFGVPVVLMGYSGTLVPAIVAVLVYSKLEKVLKKFIPKSIELFALSFVALIIMVPLTIIVIGPIGVTLANGIGNFINYINLKNGMLTGAIIGAGWTFLVMIGVHWGIVPVMLNNLSNYGYDLIRPMVAAATFASAGAAFGVFLKSKNRENKAFALSATIPALLGGVTEPIVYGVSLKYKKPLIAQVIGGAIAGGFMGMMHTKAIVYVFPALTTLPAFLGDTFVYYLIGIALAFGITAAVTYILGFEEETESDDEKKVPVEKIESLHIKSCLDGKAVSLNDVNDEVFSSESMGKGIAIVPEKGVLYAPADGEISAMFATGHAVGMTTIDGVELLMHIGINTVEMNGDGFVQKVQEGQKVHTGDVLVEFDIDKIVKAGYDTTTMLIVANTEDYSVVEPLNFGEVKNNIDVLEIRG